MALAGHTDTFFVRKKRPKKRGRGRLTAAQLGKPLTMQSIPRRQIQILLNKGFTEGEICEFYDISEELWYKYKREHHTFLERIEDWRAEFDEKIERALAERAVGYTHAEEKIWMSPQGEIIRADTKKHYPPETAAITLWLTNRRRSQWAKIIKSEVSGPDGGPVQFQQKPYKVDLTEFEDEELELIARVGIKLLPKDEDQQEETSYADAAESSSLPDEG